MNTIIVGLQWGDEGKGKVVDFLRHTSNVVRFQGEIMLDTLVVQDQTFGLHLIPSGILHEDVHCMLAMVSWLTSCAQN